MPIDKKQVFIVDDDEAVCRSLKCLLMTYGFTVSTFLSAEDFFVAVPNSMNGCLILDIHMQGLDGWGTMKRLIKSGSKRPVVMISADKKDGLRDAALKAGAVGFLQKPFNAQALVDLINRTFWKEVTPDWQRYDPEEDLVHL